MIRRLTTAAALAAGLALALPLSAAERATILLKSGERLTGDFEAMPDQGKVYLRLSFEEERRIPIEEIALIDFVGGTRGLPQTELDALQKADHTLVMRGGQSVRGHLVRFQGNEVVFKSAGGDERAIPLTNVGRIYLGDLPANVADLRGTTGQEQGLEEGSGEGFAVSAQRAWTSTGIMVERGERIIFNASGEIRLSTDGNDVAGPAGARSGRNAPQAPLPNLPAGALIGRVGTSAPFGIGNQTVPVPMPARGELFLGINDDELGDNTGRFFVKIDRTRQTRRQR